MRQGSRRRRDLPKSSAARTKTTRVALNKEGVPCVDRALVAVIEDGMVLEVPGAPAVCEVLGRASGGACPRSWRGRSVPRRDVCCDLVSWTAASASVLAGS
jgi:hypothetical protein